MMSLRTKSLMAALVFGLTSFGAEVVAQQTQPNTQAPGIQEQRRAGMRRRARRGRARRFGALQQLNLTDQQKQQARTIIQANRQNTQAQRQELRQLALQWRQGTLTNEGLARVKELRAQLAEHRKSVRGQLSGVLTPEQKTRLEEIQKSRQENRGRFGRRRSQLPTQD